MRLGAGSKFKCWGPATNESSPRTDCYIMFMFDARFSLRNSVGLMTFADSNWVTVRSNTIRSSIALFRLRIQTVGLRGGKSRFKRLMGPVRRMRSFDVNEAATSSISGYNRIESRSVKRPIQFRETPSGNPLRSNAHLLYDIDHLQRTGHCANGLELRC